MKRLLRSSCLLLSAVTVVTLSGGCRLHGKTAHLAALLRRKSHVSAAADTSKSAASGTATADTTAAPVLPEPDLGYNAREGRALYRHYCLNCHGETGAGDGFNAYNLDPHPRALADSTFLASHTDEALASAIRLGGGAVGLSTGMPPWGRTLNERNISNLVEYLRSFRTKEKKVG